MKKILMLILSVSSLVALSQEEKTWRLGIQFGSADNHSKFHSGDVNANARFHQNKWGSGALNIAGRYDANRRWMITAGLGIHSIGFGYAIAENYSLLKKDKQFTGLKNEFTVLEVPAMIFYKFNPNCKNAKWMVGAGFAENFVGDQTLESNASQSTDGNSNVNYISSTSSTKGGIYWSFRWSVAREKTFKNNSILNASVLFNYGFNQVATSTVNYTIDNQTYSHTFTNNGNFIGLRLTYFFRPFYNPWDKTKSGKTTKGSNSK